MGYRFMGLLSQIQGSELDLALVAKADLDVLAALAHAGKVNGALSQIVETVYEGELPTIRSPRVRAAQVLLEEPVILQPQPLALVNIPLVEAWLLAPDCFEARCGVLRSD